MGNGDYINKLVKGVRGEIASPEKEVVSPSHSQNNRTAKSKNLDINEILEAMRNFEIVGDYKRLIRIDSRTEEVLRLLSSTVRVDVTSFVNFLCWDFLENNPELINEIKQSLEKL